MSSSAGKLIVDDNFIDDVKSSMRKCRDVDSVLAAYLESLEDAYTNGIIAGAASERLELFCSHVSRLQGEGKEIAGSLRDLAADYIAAIDHADSYLF